MAPSLVTLVWSHWQPAWSVDAVALLSVLAYAVGVHRVRRWPAWRTASFTAGVAAVVVALQSGIGTYDDVMLSDHMVQHLLLLELAPLLILAARPATLALRAAPRGQRAPIARRFMALTPLTRPLVCLAIFCVVMLGTHLSAFYDATLRHPVLHELEHALYLIAGMFMWWPLLDADPFASHRLSGWARLAYAMAAMAPMTLLGAFVYRHASLIYAPYGPAAHSLGISALADQALAGTIMWVFGGFVMTVVGLWQAMAAMIDEERRMQARERADVLAGHQEVQP